MDAKTQTEEVSFSPKSPLYTSNAKNNPENGSKCPVPEVRIYSLFSGNEDEELNGARMTMSIDTMAAVVFRLFFLSVFIEARFISTVVSKDAVCN